MASLTIPLDGGLALVLGQLKVIAPVFPVPSASDSGIVRIAEPSAGFTASSGLASGTGAAQSPGVQLAAGSTVSTGTAQSPGVQLTAGLAVGTGAAQSPGVQLTAGLAAGTGTAPPSDADNQSPAGLAAGIGTAWLPYTSNEFVVYAVTAAAAGTVQGTGTLFTVGGSTASGVSAANAASLGVMAEAEAAMALAASLNPVAQKVIQGFSLPGGTALGAFSLSGGVTAGTTSASSVS